MTLNEMKKKALALIEENNPSNSLLTDDPDISAKLNYVINQVMFELARMKKIPKYVEKQVTKGEVLDFAAIGKACKYDVYQVGGIQGVKHSVKADGTVFKMLEDGLAEIDVFVYPKPITENTADSYTFDISSDVLEIMPYGIAADLLKSDVSAEYGSVYATRYESMLQRLDPRNAMTSVYVEGGVKI